MQWAQINMEEVSVSLQLFIRFNHLFIQMYALNISTLPDIMLGRVRGKNIDFFFLKGTYSLGRLMKSGLLDRKVCPSSETYNSI